MMRYSLFLTVIAMSYKIIREDITCAAEKVRYIATEHPNVTYINKRYLRSASLTAQRYGRRNPLHYVSINLDILEAIDNNVSVDFYFYEFLTNVYKRSFVEMHFEFCHMIHNDPFFGAPLKQGPFAKPCPYPPGNYSLYNMTMNANLFPPVFPFRKGRIYANISSMTYRDLMVTGYIDLEIKEININRKKTRILQRNITMPRLNGAN